MSFVIAAAVGLAVGGPLAAVVFPLVVLVVTRIRNRPHKVPIRPVLLLVLVELRAGRSVLSSLQAASATFPHQTDLSRASRVASVSGLSATVETAPGDIGRLVSQLARCQRSGSPAADTVRSILESDISAERTRRIERARGLPIRLMIPMALLVLPGMILLLYAPTLMRMWQDMSAPFS